LHFVKSLSKELGIAEISPGLSMISASVVGEAAPGAEGGGGRGGDRDVVGEEER
jgi:hypothetical protein